MRRLALLLALALSLLTSSAIAQNCDGFTDVLASSPFCPDVTWLATYGVTKGCAPSQFCPNENVTRLQMAAFMHRLGNNPAFVNGGNAFGTTAVLGPTDNQPLELQVANARALRIEPPGDTSVAAPNIIGGSPVNSVAAGVSGATIAGGGWRESFCGLSGTSPCANSVTLDFGTVGGGYANTAGPSGTVAGGAENTASGAGSFVAGGLDNIASGFDSFAAGRDVLADESGCAVFGFFLSGPANCKGVGNIIRVMGDHGFSVDWGTPTGNGGGAYWVEINDITPDRPINTYTNAYLSASGVWTSNSDRNKKEHFAAVDPQRVLAKLVALPVTQWNYKVEPAVLRMGPVAQDFYAAFGLGQDDLTIAQTDEAGVAFAAIQGLNSKLEEQVSIIAEQQRELAALRERVQKAETLAADVVALKAALAELQRGRETVAVK
jgi:hypothetical protein